MNEIKRYTENALSNIHSEGEMISLTDLWKEAGSPENKRPVIWQRHDSTKQLIEALCSMVQSDSKALWKTKRGGNSAGTYAHKSIALSFAKYLDPKLHVLVNQIFFERVEEEKNPDLIGQRYIKTYEKQGKTSNWIGERFKSISVRNEFTKVLAAHEVEREAFKNCTNAIYQPLFGGSTNVVREKKGLVKSQSIRDNLSSVELTAVSLSEQLAMEHIEKNQIKGDGKCEIVCRNSSKAVANAIIQSRRSFSPSNAL